MARPLRIVPFDITAGAQRIWRPGQVAATMTNDIYGIYHSLILNAIVFNCPSHSSLSVPYHDVLDTWLRYSNVLALHPDRVHFDEISVDVATVSKSNILHPLVSVLDALWVSGWSEASPYCHRATRGLHFMSPELWGVSKSPETLLEQGKLKYVVPTLRHDPINAIAERRYNVYVFSLSLCLFEKAATKTRRLQRFADLPILTSLIYI